MNLLNIKILRIYLRVPPAKGGMENHILQLTNQQRELGINVVLAFNDGKKTIDEDIQILKKHKLYPKYSTLFSIFIFYLFLIISLIKNSRKYDLIHIHGDWSSFIFAPIIKKLTRAEVINFSMHGTTKSHSSWQKLFLKYSLRPSDIVFSTGFENHEWIKPYCKKSVFQPSGVSDFFFNLTNLKFENKKSFRIITVGNLFPVKNTKIIIQIAAKLPEIEFVIIGDGPEYISLQELTSSLNCRNVVFKGHLSKEEIKTEFLMSSMFLFSSILEGTPTVIMEAMTCGLPIITSNAGKVESIITNGVNGFIIKNYDIENYVEKILELQKDEELCKIISNNNKEKAIQFSWDKAAGLITNYQIGCLNLKK